MNSTQSDGGRAASGLNERRDCVVCALSNATGIGYVKAHIMLKQAGRRDRKGTPESVTIRALREGERAGLWKCVSLPIVRSAIGETYTLGGTSYRRRRSPTVAQFVRTLPLGGRFMLVASRHAFCYIDGKIVDSNSQAVARGRMLWAYEIQLPNGVTPKATPPPPDRPRVRASGLITLPPKEQMTQEDINQMMRRVNQLLEEIEKRK